ncbi:MAG: hypothetical protein IJ787_04150 [Bacilli bacterium]|nr:hypothetical protein [Bacilli bacterium]
MLLSLIQTVAISIGHSASQLYPLEGCGLDAEGQSSTHCDVSKANGSLADRDGLVFAENADYFWYDYHNSNMSNQNGADFGLLLTLSYLDFFLNDDVVGEDVDWTCSISGEPNAIFQSPGAVISYFDPSWVSWISSFATTNGIVYTAPQGYPTQHEYYFWFLAEYLIDVGFTPDGAAPGDFNLSFSRTGYWVHGSSPSGDLYSSDIGINALVNSINNGWLSFFTLTSTESASYPFVCLGYIENAYENYTFLGYNPVIGKGFYQQPYIYEVTTLDFHASHVHSDNLLASSPQRSFCGCGYSLCTGPHSFGVPVNQNPSHHRYRRSFCNHYYDEAHEWHYEWKNSLKHRKYCSICGYSYLENHQGRYCICQLLDKNGDHGAAEENNDEVCC